MHLELSLLKFCYDMEHSPTSVLFIFPNRLANCSQYGNKLLYILFCMIIILQSRILFSLHLEIDLMEYPHSFLHVSVLIGHFLHIIAFAFV